MGSVGKTVGSKGAADGEPGSPRGSAVQILDALPLFHTSLALASTTEVGLIQASCHPEIWVIKCDFRVWFIRLPGFAAYTCVTPCRRMHTLSHRG